MQQSRKVEEITPSLSARRAWIEIRRSSQSKPSYRRSLSARRAWIEMKTTRSPKSGQAVALRKESVDRNVVSVIIPCAMAVALRKESVDRNVDNLDGAAAGDVALRKESVDRNSPT